MPMIVPQNYRKPRMKGAKYMLVENEGQRKIKGNATTL